jgi:hypothetical protein
MRLKMSDVCDELTIKTGHGNSEVIDVRDQRVTKAINICC